MELKIFRYIKPCYTIGHLYINDKYFCDTLEDPVRDLNHDGDLNDPGEQKIKHHTAIPRGTYRIKLSYSHKFKKPMPHILNVHKFTGILIHSGNTIKDTSGCILLGFNRKKGQLLNSCAIFKTFYNMIFPLLSLNPNYYLTLHIYDFAKPPNKPIIT